MTAIWRNDGAGWRVLSPTGFPDEATLHALVEEAPELLPLSGNPKMVIVGREVRCGSGWADLVGVETTGRLVLIEVKLAANPEARRAVVAQLLAYAAYMKGLTVEQLDAALAPHLARRGFSSVLDAIRAARAEVDDPTDVRSELADSLTRGSFRLVFILDAAPADLVQVVGYLEAITGDRVAIDLVTVSKYLVENSTMYVPQRVEAERAAVEPTIPKPTTPQATPVKGGDDFKEAIVDGPPTLQRLANWAFQMERDGLATLYTVHGSTRKTLQVRVAGRDAGLVTVSSEKGGSLWLWRSVFEKVAPAALDEVESDLGRSVGNGTTLTDTTLSDELLGLLKKAYGEAASQRLA